MARSSPPKIYHITHIDNLASILQHEGLWSDQQRIDLRLNCSLIGMSDIKRRRIEVLEVQCHAGLMVGACVPFYFCPRSVMLYLIHKGNQEGLAYRGGQEPILHLEFDLGACIAWAESTGTRWAFSDRNAATRMANFYNSVDHLDMLNWAAIQSTDFSKPAIKEAKQAEFLLESFCPWSLVERIGVLNVVQQRRVQQLLTDANATTPLEQVQVRPWYY